MDFIEVRTHSTFLETLISKYDFWPVKLPGLSRNGLLNRVGFIETKLSLQDKCANTTQQKIFAYSAQKTAQRNILFLGQGKRKLKTRTKEPFFMRPSHCTKPQFEQRLSLPERIESYLLKNTIQIALSQVTVCLSSEHKSNQNRCPIFNTIVIFSTGIVNCQ